MTTNTRLKETILKEAKNSEVANSARTKTKGSRNAMRITDAIQNVHSSYGGPSMSAAEKTIM